MSIDDWKRALLSVHELVGTFLIQFSGGEPFIKKGFIDLLEFCHEENINWGVITNGSTLNKRNIDRIVKASPTNFDISVDSHRAAVHDAARGVQGSLKSIETSIRELIRTRDQAGKKFPIRIKPTLHSLNLTDMPELVSWSEDIGATTIDIAPVRPWTNEVEDYLWIRDIEQLHEVVEKLIDMKLSGAHIENSVQQLKLFIDHFSKQQVNAVLDPCRVGLRDFHIRPNGDTRMCWYYPPLGNIRQHSAKQLWMGATAIQQRRAMLSCDKFGKVDCANSCLSHRSLKHEFQRGWMLLKRI